jgi:hypothetical protein
MKEHGRMKTPAGRHVARRRERAGNLRACRGSQQTEDATEKKGGTSQEPQKSVMTGFHRSALAATL